MVAQIDRMKNELDQLLKDGWDMLKKEVQSGSTAHEAKPTAELVVSYQTWYTLALGVVKQIIPERYDEFKAMYKNEKGITKDILQTYRIKDYLDGLVITKQVGDPISVKICFTTCFITQIGILKAAQAKIGSYLVDIASIVQAELFDSEIDAANELNEKGFVRAAGTLAGVTLERHLAKVAANHGIVLTVHRPEISDYNEALKRNTVFDISRWRFIQQLADIRNLCAHVKEREPTREQVAEMIEGVKKVIKTYF